MSPVLIRILLIASLAGLVLLCAAIALLWHERIRFAGNGSAIVAHEPMPQSPGLPLVVARDAVIAVEGDSLVANRHGLTHGLDFGDPWPARLEAMLSGPTLINRGRGGQTALDGEESWSHSECTDVAILLYGANDAMIRGWLRKSVLRPVRRYDPVPIATYKEVMIRKIRRHKTCGAQVMVIAPLAPGSEAMARRLAPYRQAASEVARNESVLFVDPVEAMAAVEVPLQSDGLHLSAQGRQAIADFMASQIVVK